MPIHPCHMSHCCTTFPITSAPTLSLSFCTSSPIIKHVQQWRTNIIMPLQGQRCSLCLYVLFFVVCFICVLCSGLFCLCVFLCTVCSILIRLAIFRINYFAWNFFALLYVCLCMLFCIVLYFLFCVLLF
jgi:hypothetical protein